MQTSPIPHKTLAASRAGCAPQDLLAYRRLPDGGAVVITPRGQKYFFSPQEMEAEEARLMAEEARLMAEEARLMAEAARPPQSLARRPASPAPKPPKAPKAAAGKEAA